MKSRPSTALALTAAALVAASALASPALATSTAYVKQGSYGTSYNHYSLLRTIEDAWDLPRLGRSASAPPITGIWRHARSRSQL